MVARIAFGLIALFWVTMNVLLWRAEFGSRGGAGSAVPVEVIWRKILTAPDSSSLSVWQGGKRIGFCHIVTSVGEEFAKLDEAPPEGMVETVKNYVIKFDGNLTFPENNLRLRFDLMMRLSTNRTWQEFELRLTSRPVVWEFRALAAEQVLRLHAEDGETSMDRSFRFADLQNPQKLLGEFGGGLALPFFGAFGLPGTTQSNVPVSLGLRWEGTMDTVRMGHEPVRLYRLRTRLLERYEISIWVSRAGEILRAELPQNIVLLHDQLGGMSDGAHD
jgi:hypothetical protein